jgi:hypothetical protein
MGPFAITVLGLAIAGAAASWIVAAVYCIRALTELAPHQSHLRRLALFAWPFAVRQMQGVSRQHAAIVNKAIVAFIVCLTVAVATISLSTNFNRVTR